MPFNFSNITPAAPEGFQNVLWQADGVGNISAYVQTTIVSGAANLVYATPDGEAGPASLRALVAADIPPLAYDPLGAASSAVSLIPTATATVRGLLAPYDWVTFNSKQNALGFTPLNSVSNLADVVSAANARVNLGLTAAAIATPSSLTEVTSSVLTISGAGTALLSPVTISVTQASATASGYLSSADWTAFHTAAQNDLSGAAAPLTVANNIVSIPQASASSSGYLSWTDWATFNSKQNAIMPSALTEVTSSVLTITGGMNALLQPVSIQVAQASATQSGYLSAADYAFFHSGGGSNLSALMADAPLVFSNNTLMIARASTVADGYLSHQDWMTFNTAATAYSNMNADAPAQLINGTISIIQGTGSVDGFLTHEDWNTFNSKQDALTFPLSLAQGGTGATTAPAAAQSLQVLQISNNLSDVANVATARTNLGLTAAATAAPSALTEITSDVLTITGGSAALLNPVTIQVSQASASSDGYLSKADWAYFDAAAGSVGSQSFSAPLVNHSGVISIPRATSTVNGYLGFTDWNTFSNKQNALGYTAANIANNLSDLTSPATARTNLGLSSAATATQADLVESTLSDVLVIVNGTGAVLSSMGDVTIQVKTASGTQDGYLLQTDWTIFNNKQNALGYTPLNKASNLSDLASESAARANLGLTSAATATPSSLTETTSSVLTIGGGSAALLSPVTIQVIQAGASASGYLSSADWARFNAAAMQTYTANSPLTLSSSVFAITQANASTDGYLTSSDWSAFHSATLTTYAAPLVQTGSSVSLPKATSSANGYLSSADWTTFNSKQPALGYTPLNAADNLSDLTNVTAARANLGLTAQNANLTETGSNILTITGGTGAVLSAVTVQVSRAEAFYTPPGAGSTPTVYTAATVPQSSNMVSYQAGYLSAADYAFLTTQAGTYPYGTTNTQTTTPNSGYLSGADWKTFSTQAGPYTPYGYTGTTQHYASGYLSAADWQVFNNKQAALTNIGALTETGSSILTITGASAALINPVTIQVAQASGTSSGYLSSADWTAFHNAALTTIFGASGSSHAQGLVPDPGATAGTTRFLREDATFAVPPGLVSSVSSPLVLSSGALSIPAASSTTNGYLASADWNTFNSKQGALGYTPLNAANNLSDLKSVSAALANLGIGFRNLSETTSNVLVISGGVGAVLQNVSIQVYQSSASQSGYLSATDWATFNAKQSAFSSTPLLTANNLSDLPSVSTARTNLGLTSAATSTPGNLTETGSSILTITNGTSAVLGSVTIQVAQASTNSSGYLSSNDWNTFNNAANNGAAVNATSPISLTGGTVSIQQGNGSQNGYISSTDWNTFNQKQAALGYTPLKPSNNLNDLVSASAARTNLGLTSAATNPGASLTEATSSVLTITGGSLALLNATTIQVKQAGGSQGGYLSSADWNTFNNGVSTIFAASGSSHAKGLVPDPGSTAGTTRFLREDATFAVPTGTVSSVSSPLVLSGGVVSIPVASSSASGYLSSADWTTFHNSSTSQVSTASAPLVVSSGNMTIPAATSTVDGYLSHTDWGTFNSKQPALTVTSDTNVTGAVSGAVLTLGWTGTLAASRLNSSVVQSVVNDTNVTGSIASQALTLAWSGSLALTRGGTGQTTAAAAFNALSPLTTLGDVLYGGASGAGTRLAGSTSATRMFLSQTGTGSASAAPVWAALSSSDVPQPAVFGASGSGHSSGIVPDPGATAGTTRFLREDSTFAVPPGVVTAVSAPLVVTSGTLSIPVATSSANGYLASSDWSTFNSKQAAITVTSDTNVTGSLSGGVLTLGWAGTLAASRLNSSVVQSVVNDTNITASIASQVLTLAWNAQLSIARGGTGQTTQAAAFNALSPLAVLGDTLYEGGTGAAVLSGNTTATKMFLTQTGTGSASAAPAWATISASDISGAGGVTSASAPLLIASGALSITQASGSSNGYLSSTDWNTFNNKASTSTGGSIANLRVVTATGDTATSSDTTLIVTVAGTENLIASPVAGQLVYISNTSTGVVTISGNGNNIETANVTASTMALSAGSNTALQYDQISGVWREVISIQPNINIGVNSTLLTTGIGGYPGIPYLSSSNIWTGSYNEFTGSVSVALSGTPRQQLSVGAGLDIYSGPVNSPTVHSIRAGTAQSLTVNALGTYPLALQWDSGSGGVLFGNGSSTIVASVSSAGVGSFYGLAVSGAAATVRGITAPTAPSASGNNSYSNLYWYQLVAVQADGTTSAPSIPFYCTNNTPLSATIKNTLTWTAPANAVSYNIYRLYSAGPTSTGLIGSTTSTTFIDTGLTGDSSTATPTNSSGLALSSPLGGTLGGWISFTPKVYSLANNGQSVVINNSSCFYMVIGPLCFVQVYFNVAFGGTTTNATIYMVAPMPSATTAVQYMTCTYYANGTTTTAPNTTGIGGITTYNSGPALFFTGASSTTFSGSSGGTVNNTLCLVGFYRTQ